MTAEFQAFPKIPRWKREVVITEKIDGTNAQIYVPEDTSEPLLFGSRNRWITPEADNAGFARWGVEHAEELRALLGPGRHYGEWFGCGIQRAYGLKVKRFALFNSSRWSELRSELVSVVPVLYQGVLSEFITDSMLETLRIEGSRIAPGFMRPEGIVIYHCASRTMFKRTLDKDEEPKGPHAE